MRRLFPRHLACVLLAAAACTSPVDRPGGTVPGSCQDKAPLPLAQKTDILFVIDNSNSMSEEQKGVAEELPAFIQELTRERGVALDFRVAVITTSVYLRGLEDSGQEVYFPEYPPPPSGGTAPESGRLQPARDASGARVGPPLVLEGSDPELLTRFAALVRQGVSGSGQETPFEAVRLALSGPLASLPTSQGGTAELLRDGAKLLVVVVTDEGDCSSTQRPPPVAIRPTTTQVESPLRDRCYDARELLTPVAQYADLLRNLKDRTGATREVFFAAIAPVGRTDKQVGPVVEFDSTLQRDVVKNVDCPTSYGVGTRLREMAEQFDPSLENLDSICRAGYRDTLVRIASLATVAQSLEVGAVPDPRLLVAEITRAGQTEPQRCSVLNGGLRYEAGTAERPARIFFEPGCLRRVDDEKVELKLFCAG